MLWDTHAGRPSLYLEKHECEVLSLAFSYDGKLIASGSCDFIVRLWSPITGKIEKSFEGHRDDIASIAFSPKTALLASGSRDKTVKIWDTGSQSPLHTLEALHAVCSVAFSPDGKTLASGYEDGTIEVWDHKKHVKLHSFTRHSDKASSLAFSPGNRLLVSCSFDKTIKLWNIERSPLCQTFEGHADWVTSVAFSPCGQYLATGSHDHTVKIWEPSAANEQHHHRKAPSHSSSPIKLLVFSYDGQLLAASCGDQRIQIWKPRTGELQKTFVGHEDQINALRFSLDPHHQLLVSGSDDRKIRLWDITTGGYDPKFELNTDAKVKSVALSPTFRTETLAAGCDDGTIRIWNFSMNHELFRLSDPNPHRAVSSLAFSPNGQMLASGSHNTVRLWDVKTAQLLHSVPGHRGPVESLSFSPDPADIRLVSNSRDRVVKFWDFVKDKLVEGKTLKDHSRFLWRGRNSGLSLESSRWIYFQGRRHIWLPWEYRKSCLALSEDVLALGNANGHVSFITIPGLCDEDIS